MYLQITRENDKKYGMHVESLKEALVAILAADLSTEQCRSYTLDDEAVEPQDIRDRIKAASASSMTLEVFRGADFKSWEEADEAGGIYGIPTQSMEAAALMAEGARLANTCIGADAHLKFRVVAITDL